MPGGVLGEMEFQNLIGSFQAMLAAWWRMEELGHEWRPQGGCSSYQVVVAEVREVVRFWVDFEMEPARFVDGLDVKYQTESSIKVSAEVMVPSIF